MFGAFTAIGAMQSEIRMIDQAKASMTPEQFQAWIAQRRALTAATQYEAQETPKDEGFTSIGAFVLGLIIGGN